MPAYVARRDVAALGKWLARLCWAEERAARELVTAPEGADPEAAVLPWALDWAERYWIGLAR